jgi:hypothetical protein
MWKDVVEATDESIIMRMGIACSIPTATKKKPQNM